MNICLFNQEELENGIPLKDDRVIHIQKILKKKEGDSFSAGLIEGMAGSAVIKEFSDTMKFDFTPKSDGKPLFPLHMIIGFPRPIQLKRLLRDIAALGVQSVHLTGTELGEKSYMQSSLVERGAAYKMLYDGTVQAASTHVPELFLHKTLGECINSPELCCGTAAQTGGDSQSGSNSQSRGIAQIGGIVKSGAPVAKIALDNIRPAGSLTEYLKNTGMLNKACIAAIGSERGWTDSERALLESSGFIRLGMGSRVMRTETAATVSASIILSEMGVLN